MSDLEDDLLMAYIKQGKEMLRLKERERLMMAAWDALDQLLRKVDPWMINQPKEVASLKAAIEAVLTFDAEEGP